MSERPDTSTIARCKVCRCVIFAVVDMPDRIDNAADEIAALIKDGYDLTHVPHDVVRAEFGCRCPEQLEMKL